LITTGFDKTFFDDLANHVTEYTKRFVGTWVTVTIKLADRSEYNVRVLIKVAENLLTFAYYGTEKQEKIAVPREQPTDDTAFPAITVPYSLITALEINPSKSDKGKKKAGFHYQPT
jgi:hypothetical protein